MAVESVSKQLEGTFDYCLRRFDKNGEALKSA